MLNLSPGHTELRTTTTASDRLTPPDGPHWRLVDWRPLPVPAPGRLAFAIVCLWARERCHRCHAPLDLADPHAIQTAGGALVCPGCLNDAGGPMRAAQLCPTCGVELPLPIDRELAPFCSVRCSAIAAMPEAARAAALVELPKNYGIKPGR